MRRLLSIGFFSIVLLFARDADAAELKRFGLLVGANRGFAGEAELRFAERDAQRMARTLQDFGEVPPEDLVVIQGGRAEQFRSALIALNTRARQAISAGAEAILFVYFSGHGDASELHLGPTGFSVAELRNLVLASPATFRILIVDACRSGGVTGVKGAAAAAPFNFSFEDRLPSEGFAVVTSASMEEVAQESERWGGSVFTSMLISGLSGAADVTNDGTVTLHEAYQYAFEQTLRTTRATVAGPQHPTFEYDLKGKGSIPLTTTRILRGAAGAVELDEPGSYFFIREGGTIALEAGFDKGTRRVVLPAGSYGVEKRARDHLLLGDVAVREGEVSHLSARSMRRVDYAQAIRKGGVEQTSMLRLGAGWLLSARRARSVPASHGLALNADLHLASLTLGLSLEGTALSREGTLAGEVRTVAPAASINYPVDIGPVTLLGGVEGGILFISESFDEPDRRAPPRLGVAGFLGPTLGLDWRVGGPIELRARGALRPQLYLERGSLGQEPALRLMVTPTLSVGLGWLLSL